MSKYINVVLVTLYVVLTIFCFLLVLVIAGVNISDTTAWLIMMGWVLLCFSSAYLFTGISLFFGSRLRRPIQAEEEKLELAFRSVRERAGYTKKVKLRIQESTDWNAFATGTRTIAITKGLLAGVSDDELKGLLAHELGHLISYDTIVGSAYWTAGYLPSIVRWVYRQIAAIVMGGFKEPVPVRTSQGVIKASRFNPLPGILWSVIIIAIFYFLHILQAIIAIVLFVVLFGILNLIFRWLTLVLARFSEYRQDAFAARLGFGKGLKDTLEKFTYQGNPPVNLYFIVFHSTHPIIYNRIRRLEKMENIEIIGAH
jgi:Zn-dependent protease with chaperone function